jgi:hypothetical protein
MTVVAREAHSHTTIFSMRLSQEYEALKKKGLLAVPSGRQGRHETEPRVAEALVGELVKLDCVGCGWSGGRTRVARWRRTLRR